MPVPLPNTLALLTTETLRSQRRFKGSETDSLYKKTKFILRVFVFDDSQISQIFSVISVSLWLIMQESWATNGLTIRRGGGYFQ